MNPKRAALIASLTAVAISAALMTPALAQPGGGGETEPVTLHMAVADDPMRPASPYALAFADEIERRTDGEVTVVLEWEAGAATPQRFEQGVAHLLVNGEADLALSAARAWHDTGITSLLPLQAPFLIADDALAVAVATSPIADDMLAGMSDHGAVGLALWPEDLRHLTTVEPCSEPIVRPEQLDGLTFRAIPSAITIDVIEALGAKHFYDDEAVVDKCHVQAAESGLLQGAGLPGATFTGDITFFPKYQVLAANGARFEALSAERQAVIRDAARMVRDLAIAERPSDAEAGAEWCAAGGRVVLAGPDGAAAFVQAVQPVYDQLAQDPAVASAITGIHRELAETVTPVAGASACEPAVSEPTAPEVTSELPEPGAWRIEWTAEGLEGIGFSSTEATALAGTITLHFDGDGGWTFVHVQGPLQESLTCIGEYRLENGLLYVGFSMDAHPDCGPGSGGYGIWTALGPDTARFANPPGIEDDLLTGVFTKVD